MDTNTETKSENVLINGVEHNVEDLSAEQRTLINHVADLDNKVRQVGFNYDQTVGARNHFMGLLNASFEQSKEAETENVDTQKT